MSCVTTMIIKDKKRLAKLIAYLIMGDGGVYTAHKNYFFAMNMVKTNLDYIEYAKSILENVTSITITDRPDYNTDGCDRQPQVRLQTRSHPVFTKKREQIYTGTYKGVCEHYLKMLDWETLAILYMCDGACTKYLAERAVNYSYNVTLNLKRLSEGDILLVKKYLKKNLGLEWNIQRHGKYRYLRLRTKDLDSFMQNIAPHILQSFKYKIIER